MSEIGTIDIENPNVNYKTQFTELTIKDTIHEEELFILLDQKSPSISEVVTNIGDYSARDLLYAWICAEFNPKDDSGKVIDVNDIKNWILKHIKVFRNLGMNV